MSKLILNNETLVRFVPNVLKSVQGELALFEKIQSHLEMAEDWLCANFLSAPILETLSVSGDDSSNKLLHHARIAEVAEAMLHAIPQLDLVLTPNGFGIVSNSNVAPASKERVERLLASLEKMRDDTLQVLLPMLTAEAAWADTAPCQYFQSVLYPWLDLPRQLGSTDHIWQRFQELHSRMIEIEQRLAADFFSPELLSALRKAHLFGAWESTPSAPHYKQMIIDSTETVMTVNEFARFVSKSPEAIRKRIQRGLIPAHKEGHNWYILKSEYVSSLRKK